MPLCPDTSSSLELAVGATHAQFGASMVAGGLYMLVSNTALWFAQGATPVATAGAGSMYLPANVPIVLSGSRGHDVSVIEDASAGKASLTRLV